MKLAALGYYGFGNLGDEAVLAGIRQALRQQPVFSSADLLVLTADAARTQKLHPGVMTAPRWDRTAAGAALAGTDLFVLGGGSLLQDATSVRSVLWYALMAKLARSKAKRVLWWGQGIGPLRSPLSRLLVRWIGNQADAITVRDPQSAALLKAIGVRGSIEVVADPAFALTPDSMTTLPLPQPRLAALRAWPGISPETWVVSLGSMTALPMHLPDDRAVHSGLPQLDWDGAQVEQVLGSVARAELVVAMRLHALIFAARCGVPFVALSYDPKVDALAQAAGQSDALLPVADVTPATLSAAIERVLATADQRRAALQTFAAEQSQRAVRPAEIAAQWWQS